MAAGIVFHNITTASGVTFSLACWVPDTAAPDVGAIPVSLPVNLSGVPLWRAEDTGHTSGDHGVPILGVRQDTLAALAGTDLDYAPFQLDALGQLRVIPPLTTEVSATFNRHSNTTSYTANDLVNASAAGATAALISFAIPAGRGRLLRATVRHNASGSTGFNNSQFRLNIFDANITPTTNVGDNDAYSEPINDKVGTVDVLVNDVGAADGQKGYSNCDIPFVAGTLYMLVQILGAWTTPTASATFIIDLEYAPG